ncbi:hypothetical protein QVD17_15585 [Tagetes erecta]|uniref:ATP synthase epsilon subunit C-terminal domain-containing protein n=1 Tax=Tagetes erecta TaxID=13708 RepID=A0AAD8KPG3_TARER|nr:hypothetical protein QVD17_15585 [Tagetes erecta]
MRVLRDGDVESGTKRKGKTQYSIWTLNRIHLYSEHVKKSSDVDPQEAQQTLEIAEAALRKVEGKKQTIKANLALRQARA